MIGRDQFQPNSFQSHSTLFVQGKNSLIRERTKRLKLFVCSPNGIDMKPNYLFLRFEPS